jgi:hypothetical protein
VDKPKITIAICYQKGTQEMLKVCLEAVKRHTKFPHEILLITKKDGEKELNELAQSYEFDSFIAVPNDDIEAGLLVGRPHGQMLDMALASISTTYLLTLDSDCFPVADGWLGELFDMLEPDVACAGILHPWLPPPEDMPKGKIEYRVRSQHCWETTHVACQLVRKDFIVSQNLKYATGDDTGLDIPKRAKEIGMRVVGWMPTRSANSSQETFDAEFNRLVCLIWGDRVYHHGGFTRKSIFSDDKTFEENFGWVLPLVVGYYGAEFLLNDQNSHKFRFDKEEAVVGEKMQRLFGLKIE